MLRDRYEPDPHFWAIVEHLAIEMESELAQIDSILEDDELFQLIKNDLSQRRPHTLETGRNSTPVEVGLRMLAVKRLYQFTYRETEWHVGDSLVLRWFCRVYFNAVPDHTTLNRCALDIKAETLHAFNERVTAIATELKVTRGRKLRTDGTVVETNIAYPRDSKLLADGVRVLSRTLKRAKAIVQETTQVVAETFRDRTRSARNQARRMANYARQRSKNAKAGMKKAYQRLVKVTQASVQQAQMVLEVLQAQSSQAAARMVEVLETFIPRVEQAVAQTVRRVFQEEHVPAQEKIVSLFEPHTAVIRRGKAGKETEFGRKVWLDEVDGGIVTRWQVLEGNPPDTEQWQPVIDHHIKQFGKPPDQASGDRGVYSPGNEAYARRQGVKRVILPQPGRKTEARRRYEAQGW
ncbi:MAG: ISNCY family transposase, partial [Anaerolineales bacterium]|nr:ISNCY family transposase [Anaerolineales bacterium]